MQKAALWRSVPRSGGLGEHLGAESGALEIRSALGRIGYISRACHLRFVIGEIAFALRFKTCHVSCTERWSLQV